MLIQVFLFVWLLLLLFCLFHIGAVYQDSGEWFGLYFESIYGHCSTVLTSYKRNILQNKSLYPIIYKLLELVILLPATNASSEHSFSALNRLKTAWRPSMGQDRLNHLLLLHVHKQLTDGVDIQGVIKEFVRCHPNRESLIATFWGVSTSIIVNTLVYCLKTEINCQSYIMKNENEVMYDAKLL